MPPTLTTRLGLSKPASTDNYDIAIANANMDLLDAATANLTVCTSATRPSAPDEGDLIYETDSTNVLIRQSAAWKSFNAKIHLCTSGTRPGSTLTFGGFRIFETDTFNSLVRNGANSAWIAVSPQNVADVTARNALPSPYDGLTCYRRDRGWVEVYDGGAWRVRTTAVCSSVADRDGASGITNPYNGQTAFTTDTNTTWTRASGAWVETPNQPRAQMTQTVAQSIPNNAFTAMTFSTEEFDSHNGHSTSLNTSRYTAQRAGKYVFNGGPSFGPNATGGRGTWWAKNGTAVNGSQILIPNNGAGLSTNVPGRGVFVDMAINDYVELFAYQNSGGALSSNAGGSDNSLFNVFYIGP